MDAAPRAYCEAWGSDPHEPTSFCEGRVLLSSALGKAVGVFERCEDDGVGVPRQAFQMAADREEDSWTRRLSCLAAPRIRLVGKLICHDRFAEEIALQMGGAKSGGGDQVVG